MIANRIYLDNAATTAIDPIVIDFMVEIMGQVYGNPSSIHAEGRKARTYIEHARKIVANYLNASQGEIFFTSGGSEANNWILKHAVRYLGVTHIITSRTEHPSVLNTIQALRQTSLVQVTYLPLLADGSLQDGALEIALTNAAPAKTLVSLMHANNELGTLHDLESIGATCKAHHAYFHTDTVQTIGFFPIDVQRCHIHFLSGSAHKFYGPKGTGFAYIRQDCDLQPFIDGGAQERNRRGGTENVAGIAGLGKALELAIFHREERMDHLQRLKSHLWNSISSQLTDVRFNGPPPHQGHPKILNISFPLNEKTDLLLFNLDIHGIAASGGSACSSGAEKASHVLEAISSDPSRKSVRFSFAHYNSFEQLDVVSNQLLNGLIPDPVSTLDLKNHSS